jgi:hypothetical protein
VSADPTTSDAVPLGHDVAEPPKTRSWKVVVWLFVTVLVLCLAGGGLAYWLVDKGAKAAVAGPRRAAAAFLGDLETGSYNDAYLALCDTTMKQYSRDRFVAQMRSDPRVTGYRIIDASVKSVSGVDVAVVTVDVTRGGATERHTIPLTDQDGTWLICGQPY